MDTFTARAIDGGLNAPLNRRQKAMLCMAARRAFDLQQNMRLIAVDADYDAWRHREQVRAIGVSSLRAARQRHYRPMLSHWLDLQGRPMRAMFCRLRGALDADSQARAKLEQECRAAAEFFGTADDARRYAAGFLRNKRHTDIGEAHARDLWHATFILRRRVAQLRRAGREQENKGSGFGGQEDRMHPESLNPDTCARSPRLPLPPSSSLILFPVQQEAAHD